MKRVVVGLLLVVAIAAAGLMAMFSYLNAPLGGATSIRVDKGATLRPILNELADRGVLARPAWLYAWARLSGQTDILTGSYTVTAEQTPRLLLAMLLEGRIETSSFTLAEGLNRWLVRDLLAEAGWIEASQFDQLCDDDAFLQKHQIPGPSCDGYLFPETYTFARGVPPATIMARLFAVFRDNYSAATAKGGGPLKLSQRELVTLASIVEKETGAPQERPRIACLFYNRLKADPPWKMQTDPTVIYAATLSDPSFDGNLKSYHLRKMDHPYNTYMREGLPPGPIANPGRAALDAVVSPGTCGDFFFVSMNNGRHVFCPTLDCHEKAVQKWQIDYFRRKRR